MKSLSILGLFLAAAFCASAAQTNTVRRSCCQMQEQPEVTASVPSDKSVYQLDSTWTNDYGAAVKLASLRGRPQIVTMFFANCAYACPLLVYQMQQIQAALPEAARKNVGFTLVSFDTERDTPQVLHNYRAGHSLGADWTLLRGGPNDVLDLAALLNVKFKKDAQGQFLHSNLITLLNAEGEIIYQQTGLTADPKEMIRLASELARNTAVAMTH